MTVKLGIGSYAFAWGIGVPGYEQPETPMQCIDLLQTAVDLDVGVVQIADNLPLHTLAEGERTTLKSFADMRGLVIEVGTRGIAPVHLRQYLQIAAAFESSILRVVVDTDDHHPEINEIIDTLREVLPLLEQLQIILAIENHDRFCASQLVAIMQALDSPYIGICLDTVNSFGSLEGPAVVLEQLGPYVVNLHVKDFKIKRLDHNMGFLLDGTPAGDGMLDVPWLLAELNQYGRNYSAVIELWPAPEANIAATVAKEMEWAQQSVRTMRQWIKA